MVNGKNRWFEIILRGRPPRLDLKAKVISIEDQKTRKYFSRLFFV